MPRVVLDALVSPEFVTGLRSGLMAVAVGLLVAMWWRRSKVRSAPIVGLLWAGAGGAALAWGTHLELIVGLTLLALAGLVHPQLGHIPSVRLGAAGVGAWLIGHQSGLSGPTWVPWLVVSAIAVGASLVAATDGELEWPTLAPLLWAITVAGIYVNVPDTEEMLVLAGTAAPLVVLGWPLNLARLGAGGSYAAVGLLAWSTAAGGTGRPASIVGGLACLGVFTLVPLARWPRRNFVEGRWPGLVLLHLALVGVCSRVAGLRTDVAEAAVIAASALAIGLIVLRLLLTERAADHGPT